MILVFQVSPTLDGLQMATRPLPRYEKSHQTGSKFLGSPDWSRRLLHLGLGAFSDLKDPDALWGCDWVNYHINMFMIGDVYESL